MMDFISELGTKWIITIAISVAAIITTLILKLKCGVGLKDIPIFPHKIFPSFFFPSRIYYDNNEKGVLIKFKENKWHDEFHQGLFIEQYEVFKRVPDAETLEMLGYKESEAKTVEPTYFTKYNIFNIGSIKDSDIYFYREVREKMEYFVEIGGRLWPIADLHTYNRFKEINSKFYNRSFHIVPIGNKDYYPIQKTKITPAIGQYDEHMTIQFFQELFDVDTATWLLKRYDSGNKHIPGQIERVLHEQLFEERTRLELSSEMGQYKVIQHDCATHSMILMQQDLPIKLSAPLIELSQFLNFNYATVFQVLWKAINEIEWHEYDTAAVDKLRNQLENIKRIKFTEEEKRLPFFPAFLKLMDRIEQLVQFDINDFYSRVFPSHTLFVGNAYIGKTHAIAEYTNYRLRANLPTTMIQALTADSSSWVYVLKLKMTFLERLMEKETFVMLQSFASSFDLHKNIFIDDLGLIQRSTQILICCDGIDEAPNKSAWVQRINSLQSLCKAGSVRLVFTARPSFVSFYLTAVPTGLRIVHLHGKSNVSFDELKVSMFKEYDIKVEYPNWLDYFIDTPLSLKLFCEQHRGLTITEQSDAQFTLPTLLEKKIENINEELSLKLGIKTEDHFIIRLLMVLASEFERNSILSEVFIHEVVKANEHTKMLYDGKLVSHALRELISSEILVPAEWKGNIVAAYTINERSILEYLVAENIYSTFDATNYPVILEELKGALEIFSHLLYLRTRNFVGEKGIWEGIDPMLARELKYAVLSKADPRRINADEKQFVVNLINQVL